MKLISLAVVVILSATATTQCAGAGEVAVTNAPPPMPAFSVSYLDRSIDPSTNFYLFANGEWLKHNPVPPDKSRWAAFSQLAERNWYLIHEILESAAGEGDKQPLHSPRREVGDFYVSVMDTNRIEQLGATPLAADLKKIDGIRTINGLFAEAANFHQRGIGGMFDVEFGPDSKNSSIYAVELGQGGLSLPDRDYYLKTNFMGKLNLYRQHVARMLTLLGEKPAEAATDADTVVSLETELAKASRSRVALRDPDKNYNKFTTPELAALAPALPWKVYFSDRKIADPGYEIVGQPEFFTALNTLVQSRPLADWRVYWRWQLLNASAPLLSASFEEENFNFNGRTLSGALVQEPRWKRAAHILDGTIGEALGQLYVEKYFTPEARARMNALVENLKSVFHDRMEKVTWMTDATKTKALAKFARFSQKIGAPAKFRDYSAIQIRRDELLGNVWRSGIFESRREIARIGKPVDRTEWDMTPETVNAYFNTDQNEIVFPAGILQPPFFDVTMDDAVNYGGIGVVIGHEMTHGYDDEGRKYDAYGNLNGWWTEADAKAFESRAQLVVDEYNGFEALPGMHVNGQLTLGENLADLGGVHIAYDALERVLAKDPAKRRSIDGFTPEQRFFIAFAQIWRTNIREADAQRMLTVDPHSPGQFRAYGPLLNMNQFYEAFAIRPGSPMWLPPNQRAVIW